MVGTIGNKAFKATDTNGGLRSAVFLSFSKRRGVLGRNGHHAEGRGSANRGTGAMRAGCSGGSHATARWRKANRAILKRAILTALHRLGCCGCKTAERRLIYGRPDVGLVRNGVNRLRDEAGLDTKSGLAARFGPQRLIRATWPSAC